MESESKVKAVVGGGFLALFAWWLFGRGKGGFGSGGVPDTAPLTYILRADGLHLRVSPITSKGPFTADEAITRIKSGGRADVTLLVTGDTRQGLVDDTRHAFETQGIAILGKS